MKGKMKMVVALATATMAMSSMTAFADEAAGNSTADDVWSYRAVADVMSAVNIRAGASEDSQVVGTLSTAATADVIERGEEWSHIISGGVEGYVKNEYLAFGDDARYLAGVYGTEGVRTDWDGVNLFSQPDGSSEILATAGAGAEYEVISNDGTWVGVQMDDSTVAYIPAEDVQSTTILDRAVSSNTGSSAGSTESYTDSNYTDSYSESYTDSGYTDSYSESYTDSSYTDDYSENYTESSYTDSSYTDGYTDSAYTDSYSDGYTDGSYDDGYSDTYTDGSYNDTYTDGSYDDSYSDGSADGSYDDTYTDGSYDDSYSDGSADGSYDNTSAGSSSDGSGASSSAGSSDLDLLAGLIYCEAGNQSREGKVAVGAVVMNRVASGSFANSISGVIYEGGQFTPAGSGWLDSVVASGSIPSDCYEAAQAAMNGENPVGGALYFNTGSGKGTKIGAHQFY